ncbi:c-type cytochrome [Tropicibacter sp. R16_0]|uniref:c-type cytochrome n=1 Tax=Tropicibacter sp. R16_0 TaxID=2821102 RepID=UPI001ADCD897|nr:cytochrome c [Tropicibacter sp. R16_0]MBO9449342.1 c-type cytochrome [Tropicibacter sp. R16_0]
MKAVLSLVLGLAAGAAMAQDAEMGEALYLKHCATCHGIEATGQGPMAGILVIKPVDLTQLEQGGIFPVERVAKRIDGRDALVSHGSPMPVYGDFFEGRDVAIKTHTGQPLMTSQPIVDLIAYMRTLQAN